MDRYNRRVKSYILACVLSVTALFVGACSKDIQNPDAVRQAIIDDVRARSSQTGLNPDAINVAVSSVSFAPDQAHASVMFTPKDVPQGGMVMNYVLKRDGNKWVVTNRELGGMAQPNSGGQLPPGHPGVGSQQ